MDIMLLIIAIVYENLLYLGAVHLLNGILYYSHHLILTVYEAVLQL